LIENCQRDITKWCSSEIVDDDDKDSDDDDKDKDNDSKLYIDLSF
jgi:hypothetical protein